MAVNPAHPINAEHRDLEAASFQEREALVDNERIDYTRMHVFDCFVKVIVGMGIAISEYLLYSYGFKNYDISAPNYSHLTLLISAAVCIPSVCCSMISKRFEYRRSFQHSIL